MPASWNAQLTVGNDFIDGQHQELFQIVSALDKVIAEGNRKQDVEQLVQFLEHYVIDHFAEEEGFMQDHNFSGYDDHKREHEVFKVKVSNIRSAFDTGDVVEAVYLIRKIVDSLIYHIQSVDIKLKTIK